MQLQKMDYDKIQENLWWEADQSYRAGLRNTTLSGRICEELLIESLRKCIPNLKFNSGQIILKDTSKVKNEKEMSSQIDIIVYEGEAHKYGEIVSVEKEKVILVIEVEKRIKSKNETVNIEKYEQKLNNLWEKLDKNILKDKIFLVVFFSSSIHSPERIKELVDSKLKPYNCYIFCAEKGKKKIKSGEEGKISYENEFERLVNDIKNLTK